MFWIHETYYDIKENGIVKGDNFGSLSLFVTLV